MSTRLRALLFAGLMVAAMVVGQPAAPKVQAQAAPNPKLDSALIDQMNRAIPGSSLEVIVVFSDLSAAPRVSERSLKFLQMKVLPMAGALLPVDQIPTIASWPEVYSITWNAPLKFFLHESVATVKANQVWSTYGQTGGNATVAVIDSGIDASHSDLPMGSKVIQNVKVVPFQASVENVTITDTSSGHGTHVAGTIGGNGTMSGGYYRGVAPDVKLVGVGVGEADKILLATQGYDWVLQNAATYNIRVVSNSWGSTGGDINLRNPIVMATLEAYKRGILSVFAAGNDGGYDVMNPYSLPPWVLSVAAGKKDGTTLADFSSRGKDGDYFKHPDITAPGVDILAARAKAGETSIATFPNPVNPLWTASYISLSGTSMATPHVSGAASLLFSSNPQLSPDQVMDLLTSTARFIPGYAFHESGYGYMDALAAYEASRSVTGNLAAFLGGARQHGEGEVLGFDPNFETPYDEYTFSELVAAAVTGTGPIDHPFNVPEGTLYVDIHMTWTPEQEDAFDIEIIDPQGRLKTNSGNSVGETENAFFVPDTFGQYILRIHPVAGVAASYTAKVKVAYGTPPAGWPPRTPPAYQLYLGVAGLYKTYGAVGIIAEAFRSGDRGFVVFNLASADGAALAGQAGNLAAIYTDRSGQVVRADTAIADRGAGEYQTSFNTGTPGWSPGPIRISFVWKGAGGESMRALGTGFTLNKIATTLATNKADYQPGETIAFSGTLAQMTTVGTGVVEYAPLGGAPVSVSLRDSAGAVIGSAQATSDAQGRYSGAFVSPVSARGKTTIVAEASYHDPTIATGTPEWYGTAFAPLTFPGNIPPTAKVTVTPDANRKSNGSFLVSIDASVSDADGRADVTTISLVLLDARGRVLGRWSKANFTAGDDRTWTFRKVYKVSGQSPWTTTMTAQDSAGNTVTASAIIK